MKMRVLVCDDDPAMLRLVSHMIESEGYEVIQACTGSEAWEILNQGKTQLAVLDWDIPRPTALEICKRLKNHVRSRTVHVIVLTGRSGTEAISSALAAGASDFVQKRFLQNELIARLQLGQRTVQMQAELAHAQKLESVGQLAAGIAHEINTPTQYVGDNVRFLKDAFQDVEKVLDALDRLLARAAQADGSASPDFRELSDLQQEIELSYLRKEIPKAIDESINGVERVGTIVRAMKEFSHPGTEEKTLVDLSEAIETTITVARNEWKYAADVVTDFDPDLPPVPCLPAELNQVLLNLIVNAAHAISESLGDGVGWKGTITIRTRRRQDWAEIEVADTGTGIPANVQPRIFEPFFTTKEVGKGTGQGLAIARSVVVDKHGGELVFRTREGQGTTFTVRLPLSPEAADEEWDRGAHQIYG